MKPRRLHSATILSIVTTSGIGVGESAAELTGGMVFEHPSRPVFGRRASRPRRGDLTELVIYVFLSE